MNTKILIGFVVLLLGIGAGWYVFQGSQPKEEGSVKNIQNAMPVPETTGIEEMIVTQEPATGAGDAMEKGGVTAKASVQYTNSGFSPKEITVKVGTIVTFTNQSDGGMWVASAPHPTHSIYPELDQLKSVAKGGTYEFTFTKVGTWKYHNHLKSTDFASVIVTE